jgi:hypothetical protein
MQRWACQFPELCERKKYRHWNALAQILFVDAMTGCWRMCSRVFLALLV